MGINGFQPFVKKVYKKACKTKFNVEYDNLYIDLNHVLHHICYVSKDTNDMIERCREYLKGIIQMIKPKKRVIICADGVAPLAKMLLQRKRRLESIRNIDTDDKSDITGLNLNLSPGTAFMMNLEKSLTSFVNYIKEKFSLEVLMYIIDANEGEIKIKHQLCKIQKKNPSDTHIVFSADSDVILLLFTCDDLYKIYQMLDKEHTILHYGTMYDEHCKQFIGHADEMDQNTIKNDFVFINLMMGNDYIPKVNYFKLENVWEAYKLVSSYIMTGMISIKDSVISINSLFIHDLLYFGSKSIAKRFMNRFDISDLRVGYDNYTDGLYWSFGIYTGKCTDYRYIYNNKNTNIHITGVMLTLMCRCSYNIMIAPTIDIDLYGILLIPSQLSKTLLSKEQNLIAEKLVQKHPIIYEEGKCDICKKYYKTSSELNKSIKQYDSGEDEALEISKKSKKLNLEYSKHRKSHKNMSIHNIDEISEDFIKIRDELRETMSLVSDNEDGETVEVYKPVNKSLPKKKLFK